MHSDKVKLAKRPSPTPSVTHSSTIKDHRPIREHSQSSVTMKKLTAFYIVCIHAAATLVGYDCGGATLSMSTLSLLDQPSCELQTPEPTIKQEEIQLLQLADFNLVEATQCKIGIDRTVSYCIHTLLWADNIKRQSAELNVKRLYVFYHQTADMQFICHRAINRPKRDSTAINCRV